MVLSILCSSPVFAEATEGGSDSQSTEAAAETSDSGEDSPPEVDTSTDEDQAPPPLKTMGVFAGAGFPGIGSSPSVGAGVQYGRLPSERTGGLLARLGVGFVPEESETFETETFGSDGSGNPTRTTTTTERSTQELAVSVGISRIWGTEGIQWEAGAGVGGAIRNQHDNITSTTDVETSGEWFFLGDDQSIEQGTLTGISATVYGAAAIPVGQSAHLQLGPELTYIGGGFRVGGWIGLRFGLKSAVPEQAEVKNAL